MLILFASLDSDCVRAPLDLDEGDMRILGPLLTTSFISLRLFQGRKLKGTSKMVVSGHGLLHAALK